MRKATDPRSASSAYVAALQTLDSSESHDWPTDRSRRSRAGLVGPGEERRPAECAPDLGRCPRRGVGCRGRGRQKRQQQTAGAEGRSPGRCLPPAPCPPSSHLHSSVSSGGRPRRRPARSCGWQMRSVTVEIPGATRFPRPPSRWDGDVLSVSTACGAPVTECPVRSSSGPVSRGDDGGCSPRGGRRPPRRVTRKPSPAFAVITEDWQKARDALLGG